MRLIAVVKHEVRETQVRQTVIIQSHYTNSLYQFIIQSHYTNSLMNLYNEFV